MNIRNLLAQKELKDIIGGPINVETGPSKLYKGTVESNISTLISFGIAAIFSVAGITALIYMLWGGYDFIIAGGDQEKVQIARKKITYAVFGVFIILIALVAWVFIINIFGLGTTGPDGTVNIRLPGLGGSGSGGSGGSGGGNPAPTIPFR